MNPSWQQPQQIPQSPGVYRQPQQDAPPADQNPDGMECPECHVMLADMNQRRKHAILHYGEGNIPRYHQHDTAAERKGALLNVDPERLRG